MMAPYNWRCRPYTRPITEANYRSVERGHESSAAYNNPHRYSNSDVKSITSQHQSLINLPLRHKRFECFFLYSASDLSKISCMLCRQKRRPSRLALSPFHGHPAIQLESGECGKLPRGSIPNQTDNSVLQVKNFHIIT